MEQTQKSPARTGLIRKAKTCLVIIAQYPELLLPVIVLLGIGIAGLAGA